MEVKIGEEINSLRAGTTLVGIRCKEFVLLASDKRVSGRMIVEDRFPKIYKITNFVGMGLTGSVSAAQQLKNFLKTYIENYEVERERKINIKAVSNFLSFINRSRLDIAAFLGLAAAFFIAGYDKAPKLYKIDVDGAVLEFDKFSSGSGSVFALGLLDSEYKEDMKEEEAIVLALRAIEAAKKRDLFSGGEGAIVAIIDKEGYREISEKDLEKIYLKIGSKTK